MRWGHSTCKGPGAVGVRTGVEDSRRLEGECYRTRATEPQGAGSSHQAQFCPELSSGPRLQGPGAILWGESLAWAWLRGCPVLVRRRAEGLWSGVLRRVRARGRTHVRAHVSLSGKTAGVCEEDEPRSPGPPWTEQPPTTHTPGGTSGASAPRGWWALCSLLGRPLGGLVGISPRICRGCQGQTLEKTGQRPPASSMAQDGVGLRWGESPSGSWEPRPQCWCLPPPPGALWGGGSPPLFGPCFCQPARAPVFHC